VAVSAVLLGMEPGLMHIWQAFYYCLTSPTQLFSFLGRLFLLFVLSILLPILSILLSSVSREISLPESFLPSELGD
jgi:hypothetical protein